MLVSEDSETKNAAVGEEGDEEEEYLACARCNSAIAFYRDVLCEPHPTLNSHVFTYALDIFDEGAGRGCQRVRRAGFRPTRPQIPRTAGLM